MMIKYNWVKKKICRVLKGCDRPKRLLTNNIRVEDLKRVRGRGGFQFTG